MKYKKGADMKRKLMSPAPHGAGGSKAKMYIFPNMINGIIEKRRTQRVKNNRMDHPVKAAVLIQRYKTYRFHYNCKAEKEKD